MKVLWQQLIAFLIVIIAAVALFAVRISDTIQTQIISNYEEQLLNYGNNIVNNKFSRSDLVLTSQLLASERIETQIYLSNGRTIYPIHDRRFDADLNPEELEALQNGEYLDFKTVERLNQEDELEPYLTVYLPHKDVGEFPQGFISLAAPLNDLENQLNLVRRNIIYSLITAIIIGIIMSIIYSVLQTRKIKRLQEATREIGQGNYGVQLDVSGKDEFGDLARDFQKMSQSLLDSQQEIKRQEKLRRQLLLDVAHEMRTPLTTMSGLLEGLQHNMIPENQRERSFELIQRETHRLTRLVNENLDYEKILNRQIILNKQEIRASHLFKQIKAQLSGKAKLKNNRLVIDTAEDVMIWADHDRIVQILINLVTNAIQFSENNDIIMKASKLPTVTEIKIIDHGIGIDKIHLKSIWERFYKVDESRKSNEFGESGIGLAVVKSLVETHEGSIEVESKKGQGSIFTLCLPHASESGK